MQRASKSFLNRDSLYEFYIEVTDNWIVVIYLVHPFPLTVNHRRCCTLQSRLRTIDEALEDATATRPLNNRQTSNNQSRPPPLRIMHARERFLSRSNLDLMRQKYHREIVMARLNLNWECYTCCLTNFLIDTKI